MKIEHDPAAAILNPDSTTRISGMVATGKGHGPGYRAYFVIAPGDGTKVTVTPDEARDIITGLSRELVILNDCGGDAQAYGRTFPR